MARVNVVSRRRAGMARLVTATRSRTQALEVAAQNVPERVTVPRVGQDGLDALRARGLVFEGAGQQVGEVENLDVMVAQRLREGVVLVLGSADPRDAVEEEFVVVPGGEPLQLGSGAMQQDCAKPADLGVGAAQDHLGHEPEGTETSPRLLAGRTERRGR